MEAGPQLYAISVFGCSILKRMFSVFLQLKSKYGNCLLLYAVSELGCSITNSMFLVFYQVKSKYGTVNNYRRFSYSGFQFENGFFFLKIKIQNLIWMFHRRQVCYLVFYQLKSKYGNCVQFQAVSVFGCSIVERMYLGVIPTKIHIRKRPRVTVLCSFRIRMFLCRTYVFWCFTT